MTTDPDALPSYDQLEREALAALRDVMRDPDAPAAARAQAAKELRAVAVEARLAGIGTTSSPDQMTLEDIDRELLSSRVQGTT